MAIINFQGNPIHTIGNLPAQGSEAPAFSLTKTDLSELSLNELSGIIVLNIFPSLDTPTCATSVRKFNAEASKIANAQILCISMDLPFAQARFCGAEGLDKVIPLSAFRHPEFGDHYGVRITDSKLAGLVARAVVIIDAHKKVIYTEQVPEITQEPDYNAAMKVLR
ncbi:MAG TPA: thiol peroxidase [Coxiellaceae bacterium]|nr:thiol peroxidase [Coxiellaceae bacterium]